MSTKELNDWSEANQRYLMAAVRVVQEELEIYRDRTNTNTSEPSKAGPAQAELEKVAADLTAPAAFDTLVTILGLSPFERNILLMCAGVELDAGFGSLIATLQGAPALFSPSFSLALAAFPDAHWSALSPNAPLRYWRLLEVNTSPLLTRSPLKIDEQVLHYITGVQQLDERLREIAEPVFTEGDLAPSQRAVANGIINACFQKNTDPGLPVIQLRGDNTSDKTTIAAAACAQLDLQLYTISVYSIPASIREVTELTRLWNREAALNAYALYLDSTELDTADKARFQAVTSFMQNIQGLLILSSSQAGSPLKRPKIVFEVRKPTSQEQLRLWEITLGKEAAHLNGQLQKLVAQFNLSTKTIHAVSSETLQEAAGSFEQKESASLLGKRLWRACCTHTRPQIGDLGEYIEPVAGWDDIVLPEAQKEILKEIAMQVKQRAKVYGEWGFASKSARGLGISALFTGESGTGKTMASEVLANELQLDLYRIDLSQVVNKYIGETEKNLKRIFDAAEEGGTILLFDEADALFGKRSDVKDSHDRYSNIEVSYLLQRMEAYRGLAILTTNMKSALDKAFYRRIRFVVQFPYPDALQRAEIWRRIFPANTPTENLDVEKLARLNIPGGNIRNIALHAAFIAADEGRPVHMAHVSRAARGEYNKLEKNLSNSEINGW